MFTWRQKEAHFENENSLREAGHKGQVLWKRVSRHPCEISKLLR